MAVSDRQQEQEKTKTIAEGVQRADHRDHGKVLGQT